MPAKKKKGGGAEISVTPLRLLAVLAVLVIAFSAVKYGPQLLAQVESLKSPEAAVTETTETTETIETAEPAKKARKTRKTRRRIAKS